MHRKNKISVVTVSNLAQILHIPVINNTILITNELISRISRE